MINTKFTIQIKTNEKNNTIDFIYKRKDLTKITDKKEFAFVVFAEQLLRTTLDKGFTMGNKVGDEDGNKVSE